MDVATRLMMTFPTTADLVKMLVERRDELTAVVGRAA
jgi:hypothetical protein